MVGQLRNAAQRRRFVLIIENIGLRWTKRMGWKAVSYRDVPGCRWNLSADLPEPAKLARKRLRPKVVTSTLPHTRFFFRGQRGNFRPSKWF
jgi:hypothetical protein